MKVMKWSAIALAVSAGSTQFAVADAFVSDQAEAKGFIEDSSLDLLLRNYYFNRDGKSGSGDRVDWTQGFLTTYESGFTQGTVGFGVDAFGYLGLKLDGTSEVNSKGSILKRATSPKASRAPPPSRAANSTQPMQVRPPRARTSPAAATRSPTISAPPCMAPN